MGKHSTPKLKVWLEQSQSIYDALPIIFTRLDLYVEYLRRGMTDRVSAKHLNRHIGLLGFVYGSSQSNRIYAKSHPSQISDEDITEFEERTQRLLYEPTLKEWKGPADTISKWTYVFKAARAERDRFNNESETDVGSIAAYSPASEVEKALHKMASIRIATA